MLFYLMTYLFSPEAGFYYKNNKKQKHYMADF